MKKKGRTGGGSSLGLSLVSNDGVPKSTATKSGRRERRDRTRDRHSAIYESGGGGGGAGFTSVLEVSDLAEIMLDAELSGRDFTPARGSHDEKTLILDEAERSDRARDEGRRRNQAALRRDFDDKEGSVLRLPRRPRWTREMSVSELEHRERDAFLRWRRKLAEAEEHERAHLSTVGFSNVMTPFEKNLDIWRQLWRVIEKSDLLVQIVDARDPLLFFCPDLNAYVRESSTPERPKDTLLVLNKADLLPVSAKKKWAEYFRSRGVSILFFSALGESQDVKRSTELNATGDPSNATAAGNNGGQEAHPDAAPSMATEDNGVDHAEVNPATAQSVNEADYGTPMTLNRHELIERFRSYIPEWKQKEAQRRTAGDGDVESALPPSETRVVVGMVGYPNVGKSSTINAIMTTKKVSVSSTPGRTKHFQTLLVDEEVMLCDCPGLVFPNFASSQADLLTRGVLPIDQLRDPRPAMDIVCTNIARKALENIYGIQLRAKNAIQDRTWSEELLEKHARARGFMSGHDRADHSRSARVILKDYVNGRLVFCTPPPPQ